MCDTDAQMINAYTAKTIERQFFKILSIWTFKENTNKQMIFCWCFIILLKNILYNLIQKYDNIQVNNEISCFIY